MSKSFWDQDTGISTPETLDIQEKEAVNIAGKEAGEYVAMSQTAGWLHLSDMLKGMQEEARQSLAAYTFDGPAYRFVEYQTVVRLTDMILSQVEAKISEAKALQTQDPQNADNLKE